MSDDYDDGGIDDDAILAQERKRSRLTRHEIITALDILAEQSNEEDSPLYEQIKALLPKMPDDQEKILFIEREKQQQLLTPGDDFATWEVWITSGERGASNIAQQINATGERSRIVPQSIMVTGDYWLVYKGAVVVEVIERKSILDFLASIHDGRYYEQPPRLMATGARFIYWLVVGTTAQIGNAEHRQALHTATAKLTHDYPGLIVEQISDEQLIATTMRAHCISVRAYYGECEISYQLPTVNFIKNSCGVKQLDTQESVWLVWMCTPLRVGPAAAKAAIKRYPSASSYIDAARQCRTLKDAQMLLADIQVPLLSGNGSKKFGKVASRRVLECTFTPEELSARWGAPAGRA